MICGFKNTILERETAFREFWYCLTGPAAQTECDYQFHKTHGLKEHKLNVTIKKNKN